jgi:hypothetical protein
MPNGLTTLTVLSVTLVSGLPDFVSGRGGLSQPLGRLEKTEVTEITVFTGETE